MTLQALLNTDRRKGYPPLTARARTFPISTHEKRNEINTIGDPVGIARLSKLLFLQYFCGHLESAHAECPRAYLTTRRRRRASSACTAA